jgi:hypothetical protein
MHVERTCASGTLRRVGALAAAVVLLAGCSGSDGDGADPPRDARATIASDLRGDFGEDAVSREQADCFADRLVDALGEEAALGLNDSDRTIEEAPEEERTAVEEAFNDCIPGSVLAPILVEPFYTAFDAAEPPTEEVVGCVAEQLEGRTGSVLVDQTGASADGSTSGSTLEVLDPCVPDEVLRTPFVAAFVDGGATPEQAGCAADAVVSRLSLAELVELADAEDLTEQASEVVGGATADCL